MRPISASRRIAASLEKVFQTVSEIEHFAEAIPAIVDVEFLTEQRTGVGTRFLETRRMGKHEDATELEVTEYVPNDHVRLVADSHGTIWDTVFSVRAVDGEVELAMVMEARAKKLLGKLANPLIRGMIAKAVEGDMDAVKAFCER